MSSSYAPVTSPLAVRQAKRTAQPKLPKLRLQVFECVARPLDQVILADLARLTVGLRLVYRCIPSKSKMKPQCYSGPKTVMKITALDRFITQPQKQLNTGRRVLSSKKHAYTGTLCATVDNAHGMAVGD